MEENYSVGDWGTASFKYIKKGFKGALMAYGQIKAVEKKVVLFEDDFQEYIVNKKEFAFKPVEKP